jgi:glyoxylase-like metal-dependent hydrolase (beta-lactamase superfamily II)
MPAQLIHEIIPVGLLQCNCSILGDSETREAIVIDPGDDVERILAILRKHELKVRAIVSTHTHIDHVGGLAALHQATGAPVLIHESDLELYHHLDMQAQWIGMPTPETVRIQDFVKEGDAVRWGGFAARVLHTPGHTPGSISLVVDATSGAEGEGNLQRGSKQGHSHPHTSASAGPSAIARLISGDTLFQGSIGRTDLWGGSYPQIINSIREKLIVLPDEVVVYPGHGDTTTIGAERESNPFLR